MRVAFLFASFCVLAGAVFAEHAGLKWEPWSDAVFERAKKENKFVLLDLEAVWCHWCHVMDEKTYSDPKVAELIKSRFIPVRVDQDSRPDLANRYEDYGWPATIVFNASGGEIVKRQGYIPPGEMISMLEAIIKDPSPGPSVKPPKQIVFSKDAILAPEIRAALEKRLTETYDTKAAGWGTVHKFLDWDAVEYCLARSQEGNYPAERMARQTIAAQRKLIDPVWGGVYQYSTDGDWDHPHYEKIMQFQAENLRIYALAFSFWADTDDLAAAELIRHFMKDFLMSPEGAFYVSQDADVVPGKHSENYFNLSDEARRKQGMPRIDKHIYSRENGWAIRALAQLHATVNGDPQLKEALAAANWIIANRSIPGGGFRHDAEDAAGPYLGDTLFMGWAFLDLYVVTTDRRWLERAEKAAQFLAKNFKLDPAGFATAASNPKDSFKPKPQLDENVAAARFLNLLNRYTGKKEYRVWAEHAMRYLATTDIALGQRLHVAGILLADRELNSDPLHITVVGRKNDTTARTLFDAVLRYPSTYKRVEWYDPSGPPLPNPDVEYPRLKLPAAFLCDNGVCSAPIFKPDDLDRRISKKK